MIRIQNDLNSRIRIQNDLDTGQYDPDPGYISFRIHNTGSRLTASVLRLGDYTTYWISHRQDNTTHQICGKKSHRPFFLKRSFYRTLVKKENLIFLIYKTIQIGAVAKSYMTNGLLISGEIFAHFLIY
jgi:hypothetical protein